MKHEVTLCIAHGTVNDFMKGADLRPDFKWFVEMTPISFETDSLVKEQFFTKIIRTSLETKDQFNFWIPAIIYMNNVFHHKDVKSISDGHREMFLDGVKA